MLSLAQKYCTYLEKLNLVKWTVFFIKRVKFSVSARRDFLGKKNKTKKPTNKVKSCTVAKAPFHELCSLSCNPRILATMERGRKCS